jgi:hypothetical protein
MHAAGSDQAALAQIEQGLAAYPREPRLTQLHANLCKAIPDLQSRAEAVARVIAFTHPEPTGRPVLGDADAAATGWQEFEQKLRTQKGGTPAAETLAAAGATARSSSAYELTVYGNAGTAGRRALTRGSRYSSYRCCSA